MKKAKSVIMFLLALLPLLTLLLPVIVSFGAESRAELPLIEEVDLSLTGRNDDTVQIIIYPTEYNNPQWVNDENATNPNPHFGLVYRTLNSFFQMSNGVYDDEYSSMTYSFKQTSHPLVFPVCKAIALINKSVNPTNNTTLGYINTNAGLYILAAFYMLYLFWLELISMCISLITWVPRKCKEAFDK